MKIYKRHIRHKEEVAELPDLSDVRLVARLINTDDGTIEYALYKKSETYTINFIVEEFLKVHKMLDEKFKAAGITPPVVKGTVQNYWS